MTDLRTLLHDAAPKPLRPLDMAAVQHRARRFSTRRLIAWLTGLAAVASVGVPAGTALLAAGHHGERVGIVGPPKTGTQTRNDPNARAEVVVSGDNPPADGGVAASASGGFVTPETPSPPPDSSTTTPPNAADYPPAASCSVDNGGPGTTRSCQFTATQTGGWAWYRGQTPTGQYGLRPAGGLSNGMQAFVSVYRAGVAWKTYQLQQGANAQNCAANIIEPGDLVRVEFDQPPDEFDTAPETIGAGSQWDCTQHG